MATRSLSANFGGVACPLEISFGFVHGPQAAVAQIKLPGLVLPPVGQQGLFYVGASSFYGYVTNREYDPNDDESTIRMVDWRDRLQDVHITCAFNMQESDGRYYHIMPNDWVTQTRTFVTRELGQFDFQRLQDLPADSAFDVTVGSNTLYSAWSILNGICATWGIVGTADPWAIPLLQQSYPLNLDWNNGSTTVGNAIDQLLKKVGMQFNCFGFNNLHVTIRGVANNSFSKALISGYVPNGTDLCAMGAATARLGDELNELGRRVVVIGDKNKYEYVFLCRQNWNPAWTWGMVYEGVELGAMLKKLGLTDLNKLSEMPEEFQDHETYAEADAAGEGDLPSRKTRNLMTIRDYIEKIVYKAYVVEGRAVAGKFTTTVEDKFTGDWTAINKDTFEFQEGGGGQLSEFPRTMAWNDPQANLLFPLARTLVTDSNLQFLVYATTDNIIRGADHPIAGQHSLTPRSQGMSLDVEEVMNPSNGRSEYRVRIFFNSPQFWLPKSTPPIPYDDPRSVEPDLVMVRLCLEGDQFLYYQGEQANNIRVREQTATVRNLYRAFVNNEEQTVLAMNYQRDLQLQGQMITSQGVLAEQIAQQIASQLLFHQAITMSGNVVFEDQTGFVPDGVIDSVNISFTAVEGATTTINFTSSTQDDRQINAPTPIRVSRRYRNEEEIARDRLIAVDRRAMKDKGFAGKMLAVMDKGLMEPGALAGIPLASLGYAKGGIAHVKYGPDVVAVMEAWHGGTLLILDKP